MYQPGSTIYITLAIKDGLVKKGHAIARDLRNRRK